MQLYWSKTINRQFKLVEVLKRAKAFKLYYQQQLQQHSEAAPLQFLAPYAGAAIGEYFRDNGKQCFNYL